VRKRVAIILVAVLVAASFAVGMLTPAKAAPSQPVLQPQTAGAHSIVCLWIPLINKALC